MDDAEEIKQKYGCASANLVDDEENIEVPSVGGRKPRTLSKRILTEIIEPRVEEMFTLVQQEVQRTGYEDLLASGVVITGGATMLEGMAELAEDILGLPVRLGAPTKVGGLVDVVRSPQFATGVGLVLYGRDNEEKNFFKVSKVNAYSKFKQGLKDLFGGIFE